MMKKLLFLLLALTAIPTAIIAEDEEKVRIVTYKDNPVHCLAAVRINQIDGKNRRLPEMSFEIEPGEHSMKGTYTVDLKNCPPVETNRRKPVNVPPLDWLFEPGKVYYVALDYSAPNRENWRFVVWKVEYEDGEVVFDLTKKESARLN